MPESVSKWDFNMLRTKYEQLGISFDAIFASIKDIIIKALITIQPHVCNKLSKTGCVRGQCFDLFGFDILVDDALRPWLLEVNMSPSLSCNARLDKQVKSTLLCDTFHLIGIQPFFCSETAKEPSMRKTAAAPKPFNPFLDMMGPDSALSDKDLSLLIGLDEENSRSETES